MVGNEGSIWPLVSCRRNMTVRGFGELLCTEGWGGGILFLFYYSESLLMFTQVSRACPPSLSLSLVVFPFLLTVELNHWFFFLFFCVIIIPYIISATLTLFFFFFSFFHLDKSAHVVYKLSRHYSLICELLHFYSKYQNSIYHQIIINYDCDWCW